MKSKKPLINVNVNDNNNDNVGITVSFDSSRTNYIPPTIEANKLDMSVVTAYKDRTTRHDRIYKSVIPKADYEKIGRIMPTNIMTTSGDVDGMIQATWNKLPVHSIPLKYKENKRGDILLRGGWDIRIKDSLMEQGVLKNQFFIDQDTGRKISFQKIFRKSVKKFMIICNMSKQSVHREGMNESCLPNQHGVPYE